MLVAKSWAMRWYVGGLGEYRVQCREKPIRQVNESRGLESSYRGVNGKMITWCFESVDRGNRMLRQEYCLEVWIKMLLYHVER